MAKNLGLNRYIYVVDTANSILVFGGWTLQIQRFRWGPFQLGGIANWRSRRGSKTHRGQKRRRLE